MPTEQETKAKEFRELVELALAKLKLHKTQTNCLHVDVVWNLNMRGNQGIFMVVFRDRQLLGWLQTDQTISEIVKNWNIKVQEQSAEFTIHFDERISNLDSGWYKITVETKLPYKSLVQKTVVPSGGSHYNDITLNDEDKWNKLRDKDKLIVRIAWGIWQAYKYWNEEVNKMVKDVSQ